MIPYLPADNFTASDIYNLSDLVIGGNGGVSNAPIKALLDRTEFLFNRLVSFEGIKLNAGSYAYNPVDARKHFVFQIAANSTFSLPAVGTLRAGKVIAIRNMTVGIKALTVLCDGADFIQGGGIFGQDVPAMFMHNCESLFLEAAGTHWEVLHADGNFYNGIGETFGGRVVGKNMVIAQGQLINRADMPRLDEYVAHLDGFQQVVDDASWLSNPTVNNDPVYRSCYSYGNGATTLRIPDERGMFERYLDLGRGIDNDRLHNYAGGLELQQLQSHAHGVKYFPKGAGDGNNVLGIQASTNGPVNGIVQNTGGAETRPINIGKIPLIRY